MKHHFCLTSFLQGVRRISALLVCMLFTFVFVVSPIKVKAEAYPIPPVWLPMNPYNAQGLEGNYVLLNDDQKEIVKEIIGAVNVVNLGFGQYVLMNPISGVANTRQFLREYGGTFLETFWTQIMGTSRAMTDFVGSTIYKASTYDTLEEYEADTSPSVSTGSQKYFQISPELTVAFKNWYRANGGVEDWQIKTKPFETDLDYYEPPMDASGKTLYESYLDTMPLPHIKATLTSPSQDAWGNYVFGFNNFDDIVLFITPSYYQLLHADGSIIEPSNIGNFKMLSGYGNSADLLTLGYDRLNFSSRTYDSSQFNTVVDLVNYLFDTNIFSVTGIGSLILYASDYVKTVYYGTSWNDKHVVVNIDDLNIGSTPSEYIDNIPDTGYVDINTLIGQIADEVINLRDVVEESVLVKDNTVVIPYADSLLVAIDKYINQPESGVIIPVDIFGGLTGANGPVSYLWFMTKPLVSYTGDLLGLLTLEGDGTFQFTGLGYIVIGVVTIGIIGGLVTKCLL